MKGWRWQTLRYLAKVAMLAAKLTLWLLFWTTSKLSNRSRW